MAVMAAKDNSENLASYNSFSSLSTSLSTLDSGADSSQSSYVEDGTSISPDNDLLLDERGSDEHYGFNPDTGQTQTGTRQSKPSHSGDGQQIFDIRSDKTSMSLAASIRECLHASPPRLPPMVLWSSRGLELFERVIESPDYYLSEAESTVLTQNAEKIANGIRDGTMIVDLGCGSAHKIAPVLRCLIAQNRSVDYYALDVSEAEIKRSLKSLSEDCGITSNKIRCYGLLGTFEDAQSWLQRGENSHKPKCLVSLGSAIGNMSDTESRTFVSNFAEVLRKSEVVNTCGPRGMSNGLESMINTSFLIGQDSCTDSERISRAYADSEGLNHAFILNGLENINQVLGYEAFRVEAWRVIGEWSNQAWNQYLVPEEDVEFEGTILLKDQKVHVVQSRKLCNEQLAALWKTAGLQEVCAWPAVDESIGTSLEEQSSPDAPKPLLDVLTDSNTGHDSVISMLAIA